MVVIGTNHPTSVTTDLAAGEVAQPIVVPGLVGESLLAVIRPARRAPGAGPGAVRGLMKLAGPVLLPFRAGAGPALQRDESEGDPHGRQWQRGGSGAGWVEEP